MPEGRIRRGCAMLATNCKFGRIESVRLSSADAMAGGGNKMLWARLMSGARLRAPREKERARWTWRSRL